MSDGPFKGIANDVDAIVELEFNLKQPLEVNLQSATDDLDTDQGIF